MHFQCNSILRNLIYTQYCQDNLFREARNICIIYQFFFYGFGNILFLHLEVSWRPEQKLYHFLHSEKFFLPLWHLQTNFPAILSMWLLSETLRAVLRSIKTSLSGLPAPDVMGVADEELNSVLPTHIRTPLCAQCWGRCGEQRGRWKPAQVGSSKEGRPKGC